MVDKNKAMELECLNTLSPTDRRIVLARLEALVNLDVSQGVDKKAIQAATKGLSPELIRKLMEALREYCG
jgi:hypothetical protein